MKKQMLIKKKIFAFLFFALILPLSSQAAVLSIDPADGQYGPGDSVVAEVKLDINAACINTVEAIIEFPNDYLIFKDFLVGESILSLWIERPDSPDVNEANRVGRIRFSGGIPGGYCGKIPGDPGLSNTVARLIFQIPSLIISDNTRDELELKFAEGTRVLLNDGLGSEDRLVTKGAKYLYSNSPTLPREDWRLEIEADVTPPEPFIIEIYRNPGMYDNQYYINFSTVDKQSGIDHYEVLEITPEELAGTKPRTGIFDKILGKKIAPAEWKRAAMPYLLADQSLSSTIKVKAVDKAGNERLVEYIATAAMKKDAQKYSPKEMVMLSLIIGAAVIFLFILLFIAIKAIKKYRSNKNNEEDNEEEIN